MPGKTNVFNLGALGVNRNKNPLQVIDGELLIAQNGIPRLHQGRLAIAKRDGMSKINETTAAGAILAIINLPYTEAADELSGDPPVFIAGSDTGTKKIQSSPDGLTWTLRDATQAMDAIIGVRGVAYSPSLEVYVAVGTSNPFKSAWATDLDDWTVTSTGTAGSHQWNAVCWSESLGLFCAVAQNGAPSLIATSPDGATWTFRTAAHASHWYNDVIWAEEIGLFIAVSSQSGSTGRNRIATSPDGITWTERSIDASSGTSQNLKGVCWAPELSLAVICCLNTGVAVANKFQTSPDGITWTRRTAAADVQLTDVKYSPTLGFCSCAQTGTTSNQIQTSPDGITWTAQTTPAIRSWKSVRWHEAAGRWIVVGTTLDKVLTSTDGVTWTEVSCAISQDWYKVL